MVTLALMLLISSPNQVMAQETADFFILYCFSCHTIGGGRLVGPDLKGVTERRSREWLVSFILNPKAMIDRGDPDALQILDEARGVVMSTIPGITRDRIDALIDLIEIESQLEKSQFVGLQISDRPFTDKDRQAGREFFSGGRQFANGGPACVSCHTVLGIGGLGGGRLGPDLTRAYERIGGRRPLVAWLFSPATATMKPVYAGHALESEEILSLVAHLEQSAQQSGDDTSVAQMNFFLIGLGCATLLLFTFDILWRWRFRAVRRPLILDVRERNRT